MADQTPKQVKPKTAKAAPTKSGFVRSLPPDTPAEEVLAKAKALGMNLTKKHVYTIRSEDKARKVKSAKAHAPASSRATAAKVQAPATDGAKPTNKSAFVRSLPRSMSVAKVVAKAKKLGISLTRQLVYTVRAQDKAGRRRRGKGRGISGAAVQTKSALAMLPKPSTKREPSSKTSGSAISTKSEARFLAAIAEIGLVRAFEILENERKRVSLFWAVDPRGR